MTLKTYIVPAQSQLEVDAFEFLSKNYVVQGKSLRDAISEFAVSYYNRNRLDKPFTLVTENELLARAQELGLQTGKSSIVQYRRRGILQDEDGPWFFQNQQHKVVYNLEKMIDFLKARAKNPKSRIKKTLLALHE